MYPTGCSQVTRPRGPKYTWCPSIQGAPSALFLFLILVLVLFLILVLFLFLVMLFHVFLMDSLHISPRG